MEKRKGSRSKAIKSKWQKAFLYLKIRIIFSVAQFTAIVTEIFRGRGA